MRLTDQKTTVEDHNTDDRRGDGDLLLVKLLERASFRFDNLLSTGHRGPNNQHKNAKILALSGCKGPGEI